MMEIKDYWNDIGVQKNFEDPLYLEKLTPFINIDSNIIEYGCGYGRLLNLLGEEGYENLRGYDFAFNMIERGQRTFPNLHLTHIEESGHIPVQDSMCDLVIMSTILCCQIDRSEQEKIINEGYRVLKEGGILYLSDFMISNHQRYADKYQEGYDVYGEWGIYTTNEGITVRHHSTNWIMKLLEGFNIQWFEQFDFKTMNQNFARTFHCIAQK